MANVVGDEVLGKIARQQHDWFRRVKEGSLDPAEVLLVHQIIQDFGDGKIPNLLGLRRGTHELRPVKYVIDCDADPFLPDGWKVEDHQQGGILKWTESLIALYLDQRQQSGRCIGHDLRRALRNQKVLNANVLDFLLQHPELIPEEWKGKEVFFWGTIYLISDDNLCVRSLSWHGDEWRWSHFWPDFIWPNNYLAAVRAS
ncbi:MAG: hypothetical protein A2589_00675 [Candidatus Vogelbacteria bacterium RIFOXYD1_FULL_46_19]|uniref:Uncharacterized protein n=1 Tax=Candidatus Vogelbacteria bacterium RIFOXYD1_FULL_46_19 TaxID=1802439 RepID=A0A1G2QHX7_9BACT|nr:MAG: hypothetical protein A2589_00675 [Candidatus Vogelbacteria bacterium RIFOXYD1_FULL_46_19]